MSVKINKEEARKINGVPVDQVYFLGMYFDRDDEVGNKPFSLKLKFKMAMRSDDGAYVCVGNVRTVNINDVDAFASTRAMVGDMSIVECDTALQIALATAISTQCADLSSAQVEVA